MKKKTLVIALVLLLVTTVGLFAAGQAEKAEKKLKFGYAINFMSHEFYQNIVNGAKARAEELGIEFLVADSNNDINRQISACENFITQGVDVLMISPVDYAAMGPIVEKAHAAGIYVVTESNSIEGDDVYVGISNGDTAEKCATWYVENVARPNNITPVVLTVGLPALLDCRQREEGFLLGLEKSGITYKVAARIDGEGVKEKAMAKSENALTANPDVNVIFGINDDSTTGGVAAYVASGLPVDRLTAIGFGFEGLVGQNALLDANDPYSAAGAMFPPFIGTSLVDVGVKLVNGEAVPDYYETPTVAINNDNFATYYVKNGNAYDVNVDAVRKLLKDQPGYVREYPGFSK
ncbi:MAG: sugar ABC transporter substrate-binding protein [Sphaerochaetaceae bacterium]|jgi:ABC-type sugar transport system substrate-binding protein|nr:sugar ABC transporter substrate-binding protein [Sphaerochaetaceae bacterium]